MITELELIIELGKTIRNLGKKIEIRRIQKLCRECGELFVCNTHGETRQVLCNECVGIKDKEYQVIYRTMKKMRDMNEK